MNAVQRVETQSTCMAGEESPYVEECNYHQRKAVQKPTSDTQPHQVQHMFQYQSS